MTVKNANGMTNGRRKPLRLLGVLVILAAVALVIIWLKVVRAGDSPTTQMATFAAQRGPLTISVLESGTIKAREQIIITNQLEGRTSIIYLIDEGTKVKKGDLLVELDASTMQDQRIDQDITVQNAEAAYVNAKENMDIVQNQAQSDVELAELTLEFARQDLNKYKEGEYPNALAKALAEIQLAEEDKTRALEKVEWSRKLYEEKYLSKTELQADELAFSRAEVNLQVAQRDRELLEDYTYKRQIAQLESDVRQAEMALERTQAKARANVAQARAELLARKQEYERQKYKLDKIDDQISKAKVYAPADGMVIYATSARRGGWRDNREPLDEGVEVFERQELIYLPTATSAMAEVDIHEASLEKVRLGLPAVVTVDALPGKKFMGTVGRIAPLPDPQSMWMNPDLKVYNSDIYLEEDDPALRTGMSCKVEIIVAQYEDAVYIPIQAVIRVNGKPTVYVVRPDGTVQEREVEIGLDNNSMVHVISGLEAGEVVWLAPPLKEATLKGGSRRDEDSDADGEAAEWQQRINQRLENVNGLETGRPGFGQGTEAAPAPGFQPPDAGGGFPPQGQGGPPQLSEEQRERMRERLQNMTPEQRQQEMERMRRQMLENAAPAQQEQMRLRSAESGRDDAARPAGDRSGTRGPQPGGGQ
ncbi:MAG TPA: efflux RND transporter periplasmic adaptor subunit [Sedimentisphaerales bacterium]|nr:efflux RND transporter periplasmic adaptor subunit [Sedimentisphaerales bacterium]HRS11142.1 efflux RND transporter periplasmic adaptor subunit [Sedimentisphaerales bacterium]HRV47649.1 efflux RND transporter periplasmic adaptor subunit [Sedimentisphaerales bacterium]